MITTSTMIFNKLLIASLLVIRCDGFTLPSTRTTSTFLARSTTNAASTQGTYFMDEVSVAKKDEFPQQVATTQTVEAPTEAKQTAVKVEEMKETVPKTTVKRVKVTKNRHKEGIFSPIVFASKKIIGEDKINEIRGKFISMHSGVIGDFVETYKTPVGSKIAEKLFVIMDANGDGSLDEKELKAAFQRLGFTWLEDKQVAGILKRADADENGVIDYEEFEAELSKTLRVNLIKLAKKNGEEMGFLV